MSAGIVSCLLYRCYNSDSIQKLRKLCHYRNEFLTCMMVHSKRFPLIRKTWTLLTMRAGLRLMTAGNRVHIVGAGSIGGLVGYELTTIASKPEITLLLRNQARVEHFKNVNQSTIYIKRLFRDPQERSSAKFNAMTAAEVDGDLENVVITTKTYQTQEAIRPLLKHITPNTNILLIQNGVGVSNELYKDVWPNLEDRPNIYQAVINHGAFISSNTGDDYEISHSGFANMFIGKVPKDLNTSTPDVSYEKPLFLQQLEDASNLVTEVLPYSDLLLIQIKKLSVNACINATTSIVDCVNGELQKLDGVKPLFHDIISEIVDIFVQFTPGLKENPNTPKVLDKKTLLDVVMDVGTVVNAKNSSSMRQDTLNLRDTEIDYINGYVVKLAEANGLRADTNRTITNLVKLRLSLNRHRT